MLFRTGAIYSLYYSSWRHNRKIYYFMLYGGAGSQKTHGLNLAARELGTVGRVKVANVIARLSKVPAARQWDGAMLYRIFKTYLPAEVAICYRTYFHNAITQAAVINYGLNDPKEFSDLEMSQNNKALYDAAGRDLFVKLLNFGTGRGVKMKAVEDSFAKPIERGEQAKQPPNVVEDKVEKVEPGKPGPEITGYY